MILPSRHQPYWESQAPFVEMPHLEGDIEADVVVIGAGITGLTTAALLKEAGKRVVVLEMSSVGAGTTGHSTGHLDAYPDRTLKELVRKFGRDAVAQVVRDRREAIDIVERLTREHEIDCDFRRISAYLYCEPQEQLSELHREYDLAAQVGLNPQQTGKIPVPFHVAESIRFDGFARFSPYAYVVGLGWKLQDDRCRIFCGSRVTDMEEAGDRWRVITPHGRVTASAVVAAVHAGYFSLLAIESRVFPWQSYVLAARVNLEIPDALYWDTDSPYHYTRWASSRDPRLLIIGGADHRTGEVEQTEQCFDQLREYVMRRWGPKVQIESQWSHEYFSPADGLPYIGHVPGKENVYVATGFDGDGLSFGTAAGKLLSDLVAGRPNPSAELYTVHRAKPLASARRVVGGMGRVANHFVGDRVRPGEVSSIDQVPPDTGCILRSGTQKLAIYREPEGKVHVMSAVCTHAGCIVHWNHSEKTWDCPCHGGRYDCTGRVIAAPPVKNLEPADLAQPHQEAK